MEAMRTPPNTRSDFRLPDLAVVAEAGPNKPAIVERHLQVLPHQHSQQPCTSGNGPAGEHRAVATVAVSAYCAVAVIGGRPRRPSAVRLRRDIPRTRRSSRTPCLRSRADGPAALRDFPVFYPAKFSVCGKHPHARPLRVIKRDVHDCPPTAKRLGFAPERPPFFEHDSCDLIVGGGPERPLRLPTLTRYGCDPLIAQKHSAPKPCFLLDRINDPLVSIEQRRAREHPPFTNSDRPLDLKQPQRVVASSATLRRLERFSSMPSSFRFSVGSERCTKSAFLRGSVGASLLWRRCVVKNSTNLQLALHPRSLTTEDARPPGSNRTSSRVVTP